MPFHYFKLFNQQMNTPTAFKYTCIQDVIQNSICIFNNELYTQPANDQNYPSSERGLVLLIGKDVGWFINTIHEHYLTVFCVFFWGQRMTTINNQIWYSTEIIILEVRADPFFTHIETWGFFSVPHLLLLGASAYNGFLRGPVTLTTTGFSERLALELALPVFTT